MDERHLSGCDYVFTADDVAVGETLSCPECALTLRGVNDTTEDLLDLCFTARDQAKIMPYYLHMCDLVPNAEHWDHAGPSAGAAAVDHGLPARLRHAAPDV
ncbi:MAG: hypothetical protein ABI047_13915 [Jatrophihabitantaceae bacterium]